MAEILTGSGWKCLDSISKMESVLTLNIETGMPEYQNVEEIIKIPTGGNIHFKGKNIDTIVRNNQKFITENRYGKLSFKTAKELMNDNDTHLKIPKSNRPWSVPSLDFFTLIGVKSGLRCAEKLALKYSKDVDIDYKVWMSFIGIYLAEGHTSKTVRSKKSKSTNETSNQRSYSIFISQNKGDKADIIRVMLSKFPEELKWKEKVSGNKITFSISDRRLFNYVYPLGCCYTKYIPSELKNQSSELLKLLLNWFHIGDGRDVNYKGYNIKNVFSVSKRLIEDLQEIQVKCGGNGNILIQNPNDLKSNDSYEFSDHVIQLKNKSPLYVLKFNKSNYIHVDKRFIKICKIDMVGDFVGVKVKNDTIYCRDNGKCFWSGT